MHSKDDIYIHNYLMQLTVKRPGHKPQDASQHPKTNDVFDLISETGLHFVFFFLIALLR